MKQKNMKNMEVMKMNKNDAVKLTDIYISLLKNHKKLINNLNDYEGLLDISNDFDMLEEKFEKYLKPYGLNIIELNEED